MPLVWGEDEAGRGIGEGLWGVESRTGSLSVGIHLGEEVVEVGGALDDGRLLESSHGVGQGRDAEAAEDVDGGELHLERSCWAV